jgi:hypothetical protein
VKNLHVGIVWEISFWNLLKLWLAPKWVRVVLLDSIKEHTLTYRGVASAPMSCPNRCGPEGCPSCSPYAPPNHD